MTQLLAAAKRHPGPLTMAAVLLMLTVETWKFHAKLPGTGFPWAGWDDQHHYFVAAQAWAQGNLDPQLHHYLPGYSLLGAAFMPVLPWQPFLVPDFVCYAACLILFCRIARRLIPGGWAWDLAAPAVFCATTLGSPMLRAIWLTPWSTTGSAPFLFAALLMALRAAQMPSWSRIAALGAVLGVCAGFRPSDAAVLMIVCAPYVAFAQVARGNIGPAVVVRLVGAFGIGLLGGCAPWLIAHIAAHGVAPGTYVGRMSEIGFEWRLLPLRWVEIVIDSRPLMQEGPGLAGAYPWIALGIAGLGAASFEMGAARPAWRLVAAAIALHWALYLSYRDLHAQGLWRFHNLHYFKWTFPFLGLAALRLLVAFRSPARRRLAAISIAAALPLFLWRPVLRIADTPALEEGSPPRITADLSKVFDAVLLPIKGDWRSIYFSHTALRGKDRVFVSQPDFKLIPHLDDALLIPLRPLQGPPLQLDMDPKLILRPGASGHAAMQRIEFGLPCFIAPSRQACATAFGGDSG